MKSQIVRRYIEKRYARLVRRVIADVRRLPEGSRQSGLDSGHADLWDEFKDQAQNEQSIFFEQYEDIIQGIGNDIVVKLPEHELWLLWLETDHCLEHDGPALPAVNDAQQAVSEHLYSCVYRRADEEPMPAERQESYDRAAQECHEDDNFLISTGEGE